MKTGGRLAVQGLMVDEDEMVGWTVVGPELMELVAGGVVMLG